MVKSKKKATEYLCLNVGVVETSNVEEVKALSVERVALYANKLKK